MEYLFYGFCGVALSYLFSLYKSFISLKDKVKYLEERIENQRARGNMFEREISLIYNKLEKQRDILEKEISIIYDKLEK